MDGNYIDFAALMQPISNELPAGEDPRTDTSPYSAYYTLKDVRNTARATERRSLVDNEPLLSSAHHWKDILEQVPDLLNSTSKDLEFTAWLIEALVRNYGFSGLASGFKIATILISEFWPHLYPFPDEDGVETRVASIVGLNGIEGEGTLLLPIACIPITDFSGGKNFSLWEYEQALEIERLDEDKKKQRIDSGGIELKDVIEAVNGSSSIFYQALYRDIAYSIEQYNEMVEAMDLACGTPQPSTNISKRLQSCLDAISYLAKDKLDVEVKAEDLSSEDEQNSVYEDRANQVLDVQLNTRQEAINHLKAIAAFFKKTEPHSPMAYGIEQVIRWSDMALPDLLEELITDGDARKGYCRLVGILADDR
ncbi:type VI secretion system protein TssA [Photobacterium lutimaris]|uniref:Type VI secretion system protein TssA n=1 Tax=Photobacterium lutimaris TaxID=388278 RepID=A0A2T3IZK5_9GAMM|nr:type VI secretion system protein TssA [Photobacterium lutimaris]PSU34132.1 type VI secretion system protein TssA [Photobacterium lutimaris]TDR75704.1 type VI secretion system protein ImpA [Photobacterium lutimaris]